MTKDKQMRPRRKMWVFKGTVRTLTLRLSFDDMSSSEWRRWDELLKALGSVALAAANDDTEKGSA